MSANKHQFAVDASKIAFDQRHSQTIKFNISKYDAAVTKGFGRYRDLALARQQAARIKREVLAHLDTYLLQFEENSTRRGAEVHWAMCSMAQLVFILRLSKPYFLPWRCLVRGGFR